MFTIETKLPESVSLVGILRSEGYGQPEKTVYMWGQRGEMSEKGKVIVAAYCNANGIPWQPSDFRTQTE